MLFSIITPCYNSEKTIERTLESVSKQTFDDYEYIIIDGGSTDETLMIIDKYKDIFGSKLTVISEPDNGIYDAMNKGIRMAQGELIGIVNSDDYYEPRCLEYVASEYDRSKPFQIIYGMMRIVNKKQEELSVVFYHHRNLRNTMINHPTSFLTRQVYEKKGLYDVAYKSAADYDYMLKVSSDKDIIFYPIYKILTNFTHGGISWTYIGIQESNKVRYCHGIIDKKKYYFVKLKAYLKNLVEGFE
ncbi:Colanic acid biosynthesis glycosyl transferase WcaE [Anaerovibrio sp. JC8]|uniref:glycosyltransferase family 2 protein n=1 Tax=Anaerovibrio sp. JC8 TaxID=1240085 RepID=UPI000A0D25F5|nr:glycosyltransferase family 2 protein [Anaerovibrio sp. JC8]ORU01438.1 Colanic acid biosynthesis glycosyl transferase WcaE [Anaerovibrio sp. JC8]